jgi:Flp pilus assembly protein TadG
MTAAAHPRRRISATLPGCFAAEDSGSILLEFSFSVWTLFLLTFLIFEFCMTIYTYSVLTNAAREGVRYAIVHGTDNSSCSGPSSGCGDGDGDNVTAVVNRYAGISFHDISAMTVTPSWPDGTSTPSSRVVVTITYAYVPYLSVPGFNAPTMHVTAEGRMGY